VGIVVKTSIFTTAVVCFYITYLCYAALSAYPDPTCNDFASDTTTSKTSGSFWVGMIITAAAISYTGFAVARNSENFTNRDTELEADTKKVSDEEADPDAGTSNYDDAAETPKTEEAVSSSASDLDKQNNLRFHLCMAFAAIYMSMLYTNWGTNTADESTAEGRGEISVWINVSAQWVCIVLFVWTLIAPKVCPERFGHESDE
jgi:hypothetical protein